MTASIPVELNRGRRHDVEAPDRIDVSGPIAVEVTNHGDDAHVHLNVDDALGRAAGVAETNHYVEAGKTVTVRVDVSAVDEVVTGELLIATSYGSEETAVEVTVTPFDPEPDVAVDESLGEPTPRDPDSPLAGLVPENAPSLSVLVPAVVAVGIAVGIATTTSDPIILVAVGVAVVAAVVAVAVSIRSGSERA